jgi:hypothetical protein
MSLLKKLGFCSHDFPFDYFCVMHIPRKYYYAYPMKEDAYEYEKKTLKCKKCGVEKTFYRGVEGDRHDEDSPYANYKRYLDW